MALKKISLSVTDFALPAPRRGSIEIYSGLGRAQEEGLEIHQKIQEARAKLFPNYQAEVQTKKTFQRGPYQFEICGRMDGFFSGDLPKIEEIKSSFNIYELWKRIRDSENEHPYILQLLTYGYFHWLDSQKIPELNLHLVSSRNGDTQDWSLKLDLLSYEKWLELRLAELVAEAERAEKRSLRRKKAAQNLKFPFENPRASQLDLIHTIEENMRHKHRMLIQAPTGLGKTMGVLYPTLKESLARGQRVIYVTPKNSQHAVAEDAIERLQEAGASIKAMTLTAKSKMCFKSEPICNPEFCEFAKDHYTKVSENKIPEQLSKKKKLTSRVFKKIAQDHEVCPFEIQLDAVAEADTVICDYNYVFGPRSALNRGQEIQLDQEGKPNLVIDEAHNLPARAMDYYSPALSSFALEKMREDVRLLPLKFRADAQDLLEESIRVVRNCAPVKCDKTTLIQPPTASFLDQDEKLRTFLSTYLKSDVEIAPRDVVLRLCFYWSEFTAALEFVQRDEFFTTYSPSPPTVRITCCDASEMLKLTYDSYSQVVAFSATLKPFEYYAQLSGLAESQLKTAEFISPFSRDHRKLLIIPQISSKYSQRQQNYPKIADAIQKIASLKQGNYFAFFPSFDFMEKVLSQFIAPKGSLALRQERNMQREEIDHVIESLKTDQAHIVFAVQGGVFSEGIDYPGEMVIGAFVVGPPLPNFDLEREQMRNYYEENYSAGFDYAYTYPAMAKSIQAAGRVIRSEKDRGIIVLMDDRFIHPSYVKSMPQDWFEDSAQELVSKQILKDIEDFWNEQT